MPAEAFTCAALKPTKFWRIQRRYSCVTWHALPISANLKVIEGRQRSTHLIKYKAEHGEGTLYNPLVDFISTFDLRSSLFSPCNDHQLHLGRGRTFTVIIVFWKSLYCKEGCLILFAPLLSTLDDNTAECIIILLSTQLFFPSASLQQSFKQQ